jgi:hypothetical protein
VERRNAMHRYSALKQMVHVSQKGEVNVFYFNHTLLQGFILSRADCVAVGTARVGSNPVSGGRTQAGKMGRAVCNAPLATAVGNVVSKLAQNELAFRPVFVFLMWTDGSDTS